ncbi:hypothetical protein P3G55_03105 [Leptospira sp. 96542]|nr:hypothetical protein [Leptospira sp. 96542]
MNITLTFCILFSTILTSLVASGGVGGGGVVNIPQGKDRETYHLGKAVYNRELDLVAVDEKTKKAQADLLESLQGLLPNTEKRRVNLSELAGKLNDEQLKALEYFVGIRFNVKTPNKEKPSP